MSDFRPCKVACGEKRGSYFKDEILLPITPALVADLVDIYEEKAMGSVHYSVQGQMRSRKDFFQDAYNYWKETREAYDRMNPEEEKDAKPNP